MQTDPHAHPEVDRSIAAATGLMWLDDMRASDKWDLTVEETCSLLGTQARNTYRSWLNKSRANGAIDLGIDTYTRLSLLAGIHSALAMSAPNGEQFNFFKCPIAHPMFNGSSAKDLLLNNPSLPYLMAVRKHFDARRA